MKHFTFVLLVLASMHPIFAQEKQAPKFYIGLSYGRSFTFGDFADSDPSNLSAGFAENGQKLDVFGAYFLTEKTLITGGFRLQAFETTIDEAIDMFSADNPGVEFTGSTEDWQTYSFVVGLAYKVTIGPKFKFFPRFALGPLFAENPSLMISAPNAPSTNNFERSSETGIGLGYEVGINFQRDIGRRLTLVPSFTFSGGRVTFSDVVTTTDNVIITGDYQPVIQSFNLGLSLGYRFY